AECLLVEAQDADGGGGVATTDDREGRGVDERLGDGLGALGRGRYPDKTQGAKIAGLLRAVADQLDV
ncbi:hypothetical protein ACWCQ0_52365, partial [Streptomyces massasporeus]